MSVEHQTRVIDTGMFGLDQATAVYLIPGRRPALVDSGAAVTSKRVIARLEALGIEIETILLTHIHFDHAGGAGHLLKRFPDASVHVPERVARHLADPSRLSAGVRAVWGERTDDLFGEPESVAAERIRSIGDGDTIDLGDRQLRVIATPGHTRAHLAYLDEASGELFCGDALGLELPGCMTMRPATPPADHDFQAALASIARIDELKAERLLLSHYGPAENPPEVTCSRASEALTRWRETFDRVRSETETEEDVVRDINCVLEADLELVRPSCRRKLEAINPVWLNVQGMSLDAARTATL